MTSLKKLLVVLAASLPLAASAQPAAEPPPAAPPPAAAPEATPPPAPPAPAKPAAAPAAAKPLYQIYGTLNLNAHVAMAKGATDRSEAVTARGVLSPDSSNIGIRGTADVAHGLGIVYQCETTANLDVGGVGLCNRNSRIGVSSPWGTLFYGNWDTPYKAATYGTKADDPFGNTDVFGAANIMGSAGFNQVSAAWTSAVGNVSLPDPLPASTTAAAGVAVTNTIVRGFDLRAQNSVAYHSPKFAGASIKLQASLNELKTGGPNEGVFQRDPQLYSAAINYDYGPLSVTAAVERHYDAFGLFGMNSGVSAAVTNPVTAAGGPTFPRFAFTVPGTRVANNRNTTSIDDAWKVAAGYELATPFGTVTLAAAVEQLIFKQDDAPTNALTEYNRMAYNAAVKYRVGPHEFRLRYNLADDGDCEVQGGASCSTDGYGAQNLTAGYAYHLSKAAQVYAFFTRIENEVAAQYTFGTAGTAVISGNTAQGADPQAYGLGLRYAF
jgi:predicted porin